MYVLNPQPLVNAIRMRWVVDALLKNLNSSYDRTPCPPNKRQFRSPGIPERKWRGPVKVGSVPSIDPLIVTTIGVPCVAVRPLARDLDAPNFAAAEVGPLPSKPLAAGEAAPVPAGRQMIRNNPSTNSPNRRSRIKPLSAVRMISSSRLPPDLQSNC